MKKKVVVILSIICLFLAISAYSSAESNGDFEFRNGVRFGDTYDDICNKEQRWDTIVFTDGKKQRISHQHFYDKDCLWPHLE